MVPNVDAVRWRPRVRAMGRGSNRRTRRDGCGRPAGGRVRLLFFSASWCAACKAIESFVAKLGVEVTKVDISKEPGTGALWGVKSLPTFVLVDGNDRELGRVVGADRAAL